MKKRFILRKFVIASSIKQALKIESLQKADEVFLDMEYFPEKEIGFKKNDTNTAKHK